MELRELELDELELDELEGDALLLEDELLEALEEFDKELVWELSDEPLGLDETERLPLCESFFDEPREGPLSFEPLDTLSPEPPLWTELFYRDGDGFSATGWSISTFRSWLGCQKGCRVQEHMFDGQEMLPLRDWTNYRLQSRWAGRKGLTPKR